MAIEVTKQIYKPSMTVGQVYARVYGSLALPMPVGNVLELGLEHSEDVQTQEDMTKLGGGTHAEVRRVWPDQVVIRLEEQLPVARWGDEALLNNQGEAFTPRELANYEHLPQLFGPQRAQQQVMQQYQVLSQMLRPMGFSIARLELRERGSWFLTTGAGSAGPGIELLLGRGALVEKMRRFIAIYDKTLKEQITNIARIDLRYANGLAVGWREPATPEAAQPAVAKN